MIHNHTHTHNCALIGTSTHSVAALVNNALPPKLALCALYPALCDSVTVPGESSTFPVTLQVMRAYPPSPAVVPRLTQLRLHRRNRLALFA